MLLVKNYGTNGSMMRMEQSKPKPACFGCEHGLKKLCKFCEHHKECGEKFWNAIAQDGKSEPLPERNLDD